MKRKRKADFELMKRIEKLIEELNFSVDAVIVEGSHDEKALRRYGYRGKIIRFCDSRKPIFQFTEKLAEKFKGKRIAVLMDFDSEGEKLSKRLENELEEMGVKVHRYFRKTLKNIMIRENILAIEELTALRRRAYR
ncbi:MAG: toprim domain-containing protein [archaeon GB-1867-005]|nr:toprim domain-containing protein [Candidatus Culexmicrobium cathedralense]